MKPLFCLLLFCLPAAALRAQDPVTRKPIVFEGYLMIGDSIPAENAYLINYRSMKIVTTDSTGFFRTWVEEGDSLMVNHLSLQPKVVHANSRRRTENRIRVDYRIYAIKPVVANEYALEMKYFEKNMARLYAELENLGFKPRMTRYSPMSVYNPDEFNPGLTVNLSDLFRLFSRKR